MGKIFFIEGCNNTTKTTLLNKIMDRYDDLEWEYVKCSQPKDGDAYREYMNKLIYMCNYPDKNFVVDRFHFGCLVYGPMYRGGWDLTVEQFEKIEDKILDMYKTFDIMFIVSTASVDFMKRKHVEEKEEYVLIEDIKKEKQLFEEVVNIWTSLDIIEHNVEERDLWQTDDIKGFMGEKLSLYSCEDNETFVAFSKDDIIEFCKNVWGMDVDKKDIKEIDPDYENRNVIVEMSGEEFLEYLQDNHSTYLISSGIYKEVGVRMGLKEALKYSELTKKYFPQPI
jgi:hypothetical protein